MFFIFTIQDITWWKLNNRCSSRRGGESPVPRCSETEWGQMTLHVDVLLTTVRARANNPSRHVSGLIHDLQFHFCTMDFASTGVAGYLLPFSESLPQVPAGVVFLPKPTSRSTISTALSTTRSQNICKLIKSNKQKILILFQYWSSFLWRTSAIQSRDTLFPPHNRASDVAFFRGNNST